MVRNLETPACHRTPTSHFPLPTSHFPLPTSHFPLPTSHFPLPTSHFLLPTSYFPLPTSHFPLPTSHFPRPTSHVPRPSRSDIFCHRGRRRSSFRAKRCEFGSFHDFSSPPPRHPAASGRNGATSGRRRGLPPLAPLRLDAARLASVITRAAAEVWQCRQVSLPPQSGQWSVMASLLAANSYDILTSSHHSKRSRRLSALRSPAATASRQT